MTDKKIHIISLDVPFPANYGGVVDIFYRIKALHSLGYKITLHCFEYGRGRPDILNEFTDKVIYYPRKKSVVDLFKSTPFIVESRKSKELLKNLLIDDAPIFFEGIHSCFHLDSPKLRNRVKIVRCHNIEQDYYRGLAEKNKGWKRWFFNLEAKKLERYEPILKYATSILAVQDFDLKHFEQFCSETYMLRSSINLPNNSKFSTTEKYGLYHGNLSVIENEEAALWLLENVFINLPNNSFKICGKDPSERLIKACNNSNIELIPNPSEAEMDELINKARLHVLHTNQPTGLKLKVLNVLMSSGKIILNENMIVGTPFYPFCILNESPSEFIDSIKREMCESLDEVKFKERSDWVQENLDIRKNCSIIEQIINTHQNGINK